MAFRDRFYNSDFARVFHFRTEEAKGRSLLLVNSLLANIANVFISKHQTLYQKGCAALQAAHPFSFYRERARFIA